MPMTFAAYFANVPQVRVQPNGDTLHCFATGDEYFHRLHDADGFTIVLDQSTGYYVYADKVGDRLVPTAYVAGRVNPAEVGLTANLCISAEQWRQRRAQREAATPARPGTRDGQRDGEINHGHINNIVVFIRFADDSEFTNQFNTVNRMFNDSTGGNSSMYNYFKAATYNQLNITSTFYPPQSGGTILSYQDTYNRSYFEPYSSANPNGYATDDNDADRTAREHQLLARAVNAIASQIPADLDIDYNNDNCVDNVVFVVRGNVGDWNALLWPHRWVLYNENVHIHGLRVWDFNLQLADASAYFNTSVLCHEMNHSLGAPDLYHYYEGTDLSPVGRWDLMHSNTNPPQHMGAYMKYKYGHWIDSIPEITECGTYSLHSLGSSATHNCYKIASPNPDEFFVLEYRNKNDLFEGTLPGSGLLVYRINTSFEGNAMWNGVDVFDEVYVYRPFGTPTNDGNISNAVFSANSGRTEMSANTNPQPFLTYGTVVDVDDFTIREISEAGGDSMTFKFCASQYISMSPETVTLNSFAASAGSVHITSDMSWTVTGVCDWLTVTPVADSGSVDLQIVALTENVEFESRSCVITVTASNGDQQTLTVIQRGQEPYLFAEATDPVSGTIGILNHVNSTCNIEINSNVAWTISTDVDWMGFSQTQGEGLASVSAIALSENTTCVPRLATVTVSNSYGQSVVLQVRQNKFFSGMMEVSPTALLIDNIVGATVQLSVAATDAWSIVSLPTWLSATPEAGDASDYNVVLTATAVNNSTSPRSAIIYVMDVCGRPDSQVPITVTQPEGYMSLSATSVTVGYSQGSEATVTVSCSGSWSVVNSSIPEWLSVQPTSATGDADVTMTALSDNPDEAERSAIVKFTYTLQIREEVLVTQEASTGIVELAEVSMLLYPNPVNDQLTVNVEGARQYTVYDATGRSILRGNLSDSQNTISFAGFENGIYFVRFRDIQTGKTAVAKVVKR